MTDKQTYDLAVTGGGLAGLALSIQMAHKGYKVILFEKEQYPFHRVCGEYISMESWEFLQSLGVDLPGLMVSKITKLRLSAVNGKMLEQPLPLGGFGVSRYKLDHALAVLARQAGVNILEGTRVMDMQYTTNGFSIDTTAGQFRSKTAAGSFGKRANLDIKWKRSFSEAAKNKLNNYIGVKYHIRSQHPDDTIALHLFKDGYCGIVKIEGDLHNLCYLTTAANLQQSGNIKKMEANILSQNPHLKKILKDAEWVHDEPVVISQISFDKKTQVENHILMTGDAAGMITPLCGNGMSMALHASVLAAGQIHYFLKGTITREQMEINYQAQWQHHFAKRLKTGRRIQRMFGSKWLTNLMIWLARPFPGLISKLISNTHGIAFQQKLT